MNHDDLVKRAGRWLRSKGCSVVLEELVAYTKNGETPDAIGWVSQNSVLVECKVSRADFLRDAKKPFRNPLYRSVQGMGRWRFYLTPPGLLGAGDCPEGWGIYEVRGRSVKHAFGVEYKNGRQGPFQPCLISEQAMLLSALRRALG